MKAALLHRRNNRYEETRRKLEEKIMEHHRTLDSCSPQKNTTEQLQHLYLIYNKISTNTSGKTYSLAKNGNEIQKLEGENKRITYQDNHEEEFGKTLFCQLLINSLWFFNYKS